MFRSLVLVLLLSLCSIGQAQQTPFRLLRDILKGEYEKAEELITDGLKTSKASGDTLSMARHLEMLGELHFRLNDIGEAKRLWDEGQKLRVQKFGADSPEAGVGYAYRTRYHGYMCANQLDHRVAGEGTAVQALAQLERKGNIDTYERILALRERAYIYKVYAHGDKVVIGHEDVMVNARKLFGQALAVANQAKDTIWMAQVLHDIANTYTDQVQYNPLFVDDALKHYALSVDLMVQAGLKLSDPVMMAHYAMGLMHLYADHPLDLTVASFKSSLRVMHRMAGAPEDVDVFSFNEALSNRGQVLETMKHLAEAYEKEFDRSHDPQHLDQAIEVIEAAMPYFNAMLREYRSGDLEKVLGTYNHNIHGYATHFYLRRYRFWGEIGDLQRALISAELNRNNLSRRQAWQADNIDWQFSAADIDALVRNVPPGTLVLNYHFYFEGSLIVISRDQMELVDLGRTGIFAEYSRGQFEEFMIDRRSDDPNEYVKHAWHWYRTLLAPVLEVRPERELVVIPYGCMCHLRLEALVMDTVHQGWNMNYVGHRYQIRYATSLDDAIAPVRTISGRDGHIALSIAADQTDLPFARALATRTAERWSRSVMEHTGLNHLREMLMEPGLLHLASHAQASTDPDEAPMVHLFDGRWPIGALDTINVRKDLVVMANCSGGSGRMYSGEGTMSISRTLLRAGAGSVVHTLWPVDDRATNEILGHMYAGLADGMEASDALRKAKMRFIEEHRQDGLAAPFYWSGIVLTGNDVRIKKERGFMLVSMFTGAGLLMLGFIFYSRSRNRREKSRT